MNRSGARENDTVLIVGGVDWLKPSHVTQLRQLLTRLHLIDLSRETLTSFHVDDTHRMSMSRMLIVAKIPAAGFTLPVTGIHQIQPVSPLTDRIKT